VDDGSLGARRKKFLRTANINNLSPSSLCTMFSSVCLVSYINLPTYLLYRLEILKFDWVENSPGFYNQFKK